MQLSTWFALSVLVCLVAGGATPAPTTAAPVVQGDVICPDVATAGTNITCQVQSRVNGVLVSGCIVSLMYCPAGFSNTTTPTIFHNGTNVGTGRTNFTFVLSTAGNYSISGWYNMTARQGPVDTLRVVAAAQSDATTTSSCAITNYTTMQTLCIMNFNDQFGNLVQQCNHSYAAGGMAGAMSCTVL
jgi:hypothetical protein